MKTNTWKSLAAVVAAGALVLSLGLGAAARGRYEDRDERGLQGTWKVTVNLHNCQTGALIGGAFHSFQSFHRGGTTSESTSNPGFAVGQRGPGLGIWNYVGNDSYHAITSAFIFYTTPPNPPANPGFEAGTQTIDETIAYDEHTDTWSSTGYAAISFADATGTVYRQGCATATGERLK